MLIRRVVTAVIGLPFLLWGLSEGSPSLVAGIFAVCSAISVREAAKMILPEFDALFALHSDHFKVPDLAATPSAQSNKNPAPQYRRAALLCAAGSMILFIAVANAPYSQQLGLVACALAVATLASIFLTRGIDAEVSRLAGVLLTIVYAGLPWILIWQLYEMQMGPALVFMLLAVVWGGDTGAYFGGRFFGKHKLSPHKSPKKTWEGAVAGMLTSILMAVTLDRFTEGATGGLVAAVLAAIIGGSLGQLGDLVESVIKRFAGVKDSGGIFPGHGGFLDRVDGLLVAAPGLWMLYSLLAVT
jgi:phosphatidate cytidylyltransferase